MPMRILLILFFLLLPLSALAQSAQIAAVVNDDIITSSDVDNRLAMAMLTAGLPPSAESQARLLPQVVRGLIDEKLQLQEATRNNISVDDAEIAEAKRKIAEGNQIAGGDVDAFLLSNGVNPDTLTAQVRANLAWGKMVARRLRPLVEVGEEEVTQRINQLKANAGKPEYLLGEIFLTVDGNADEAQIKAFAEGLVEQLRSGAPFQRLAQQFSQSASAAAGGDLGWLQPGQLEPEQAQALAGLTPGQIVGPLRLAGGYSILAFRDQRVTATPNPAASKVTLLQIAQAVTPETQAAVGDEAKKLVGTGQSCAAVRDAGKTLPNWQFDDLGEKTLAELPSWLAKAVTPLSVGEASTVYLVNDVAVLVMLCARDDQLDGLPSREEMTNNIGMERLELSARRLLRDLRRRAHIDVKS